jgi:hypothetical protein
VGVGVEDKLNKQTALFLAATDACPASCTVLAARGVAAPPSRCSFTCQRCCLPPPTHPAPTPTHPRTNTPTSTLQEARPPQVQLLLVKLDAVQGAGLDAQVTPMSRNGARVH